jgi:hypothetical protein
MFRRHQFSAEERLNPQIYFENETVAVTIFFFYNFRINVNSFETDGVYAYIADIYRSSKEYQKSRSHLQIVGARRVT